MKVLNAKTVQTETNKDKVLSGEVKYNIKQGWPEIVGEEFDMYMRKKELLTTEKNIILRGHRVVISENLR